MPFIRLPPFGGIRGGCMCYTTFLQSLIIKQEEQHMHRPWDSLITVLSEITRENLQSIVCCSHCGNRHTYVKWGFYSRYLFNDELINIQRYRCDNDLCPCRTFSTLPHALLPMVRASLCMFMYVLKLYEQGETIAGIARHTGNNWPRIQRWISKALSIRKWLWQECSNNSPCLSPDRRWTSFNRDFSWTFYPKKIS